jgi:hypothetical protein
MNFKVGLVLVLSMSQSVLAQNTLGLIDFIEGNQQGYVLFSPMSDSTTYLIDKCGEKVHEWHTHNRPGLGAQLGVDGFLYRSCNIGNTVFQRGGRSGRIEKLDWESNLVWSYDILDTLQCSHHDFHLMPNGNILLIVWDRILKTEAESWGKNPQDMGTNDLWGERIIEIEPVGSNQANIVWEWSVWDHLIQDFDSTKPNFGSISANPHRVNINFFPGGNLSNDWLHFNSITYNEQLNQILISVHTLSELWIIDHSTTTEEAATSAGGLSGKGGDLLFRWGNPEAYGLGTANNQRLYSQHHASWIPLGMPHENQIIVFNNGLNSPQGNFSSVLIFEPPRNGNLYDFLPGGTFGPENTTWSYEPNTSLFYGGNLGGVFPLSNGNYFATIGPSSNFFEITGTGEVVWRYKSPISGNGVLSQGSNLITAPVFRAEFIPMNFAGIAGQNLQAYGAVELNAQSPSICEELGITVSERQCSFSFELFPNPTHDYIEVRSENRGIGLEVSNILGEHMLCLIMDDSSMRINISSFAPGIYFISLGGETRSFIKE